MNSWSLFWGLHMNRDARWAALPLRMIAGFGFIAHGFAKLERGPEAFAGILQAMRVPFPYLMSWGTILIELIGGLCILAGALIPIVSVPLAAVLIVAALTVHLPYGFSSIKLQAVTAAGARFGSPGYELDLLYLASLATLVIGGSGPLALDSWISRLRSRRTQR